MPYIRHKHQPVQRTLDATLDPSRKNRDRHAAWLERSLRGREAAVDKTPQRFTPQLTDAYAQNVMDAHLQGRYPANAHLVPLLGLPAPTAKAKAIMAAATFLCSLRVPDEATRIASDNPTAPPPRTHDVSPTFGEPGVPPSDGMHARLRRDLISVEPRNAPGMAMQTVWTARRVPPPHPSVLINTVQLHEIVTSHRRRIQREREERLQKSLFLAGNLTHGERASSIYFDGNALVHAAHKSVDDLADDPSLMRLPDFAKLPQPDRRKMVVQWLDAHGQDTQYTFGTFEHSMASVLKTAALSRGQAAPQPYPSHDALGSAFARLTHEWPSPNSTLIDPRILFGLHLVKTHGIELHGPSSQRLNELEDTVADLLTDVAGPPVFDKKAAALDLLAEKTGLSKDELTASHGRNHHSILDRFMHFTEDLAIFELPQSPYYPATFVIRTPKSDGMPRHQIELDARSLLAEARARFKAGLPDHPWFAARARLELRRQNVPQTANTVAEEIDELVAQYRIAFEGPPELRHWLDNMPIISNVIGFTEGIARGDVDEIISSVPVIANLYNAVGGAVTGDGKRTATALITLIPYVGSGYIIADGVSNNDTAEIVGGTIGLGMDFMTAGEGHLLTRSRAKSHSALSKGAAASHAFSGHEVQVPAAVRLQAEYSLGALRDLGVEDRALMFMDKAGKYEGVHDAYELVNRDEGAPLSPEMQKLVERLTPVPKDKRPPAMRPSEGGTWQDPVTLAHYARIGANLYRVAKDDAASMAGYAVWNPTDSYGHGQDRTIRLVFRERWQEARDVPGLKGGAPQQIFRVVNTNAAKLVDLPVPQPYANASPGRRFALTNEPLAVSETQTVIEARKVLSEDARDVTRREDFAQGFDQYFAVAAQAYDGEPTSSAKVQEDIKSFFTSLYDESETFRSLYNFAVDSSRIGPNRKWRVSIGSREDLGYVVQQHSRIMSVPHIDTVIDHPLKFLSKNGELVNINSKAILTHEMVHLLTGLEDPDQSLWDQPGTVDIVRTYGLGERGAVEYLAQRIMREASVEVPQRQTYLGMRPEMKSALEEHGVANYVDLDTYVSLQDRYLDILFPNTAEHPAFGSASAYESDRLQGVSDPDNKYYSGPTGAGTFNMDSIYWKSSR